MFKMRKNKISTLTSLEITLLYIESFMIFGCLLLYILQFSFSVKMYAYWSVSSKTYYYYLMNVRFAPSKYMSDIKILNDTSANCSSVTKDPAYSKYEFMNILGLRNANPVDVTNYTQINNPNNISFVQNNTFQDYSYYDVDVTQTGNRSINFITNYPMRSWKNYSLCIRFLNMDDDGDAFQVIPTQKQCNNTFGTYAVDCGTYRNNLFRICVRKDYLTYSSLKTPFVSSASDPNGTDTNVCPFNYLRVNTWNNPTYNSSNYNTSDPNYKQYIFNYTFTRSNIGNDIDSNIIVNIGMMKMDGCPYINSSQFDQPFIYSSQSPNFMNMGNLYGFYDSMNLGIDSYDWLSFYNESTFYLFNNVTPYVGFLPGDDSYSFYRPITQNNSPINLSLSTINYELISANCFNQAFNNFNNTDILSFQYKNKTSFLKETLGILICWSMVAIFVSVFNQIYIRFYLINQKLNDTISNEDKESEIVSKITSKFIQSIIYFVQYFSIFFNKTQFDWKINNLSNAIQYQCFTKPDFVQAVALYKTFLNSLSNDNNTLIILISISLFFDFYVSISYLILWHSEQSLIKEKIKQEEIKKKEEELISKAIKDKFD